MEAAVDKGKCVETLNPYGKGASKVFKSTPGIFYALILKNLRNGVKDDRRLPVWEGEFYFEYHRGTYTSMARNKRSNRKRLELGLMDSWAVVCFSTGTDCISGRRTRPHMEKKSWSTSSMTYFPVLQSMKYMGWQRKNMPHCRKRDQSPGRRTSPCTRGRWWGYPLFFQYNRTRP